MILKKLASFVLLMGLPFVTVNFKANNACTSYWSYLFMYFSSDCYFNPDVGKHVPEIANRHAGVFENHEVPTEDGYVLTLFRIPRADPKDVILFQHPMNWDSRIWVAQSEDSIAFLFWKAGYDVWLANQRGTFYSKKHKNLTAQDKEFWDFSLQEIGMLDNKALIDYIRKTTNRTIIYFGYSIGAAVGHIYASTRRKEAEDSVKLMISMASATHVAPFLDKINRTRDVIFAFSDWMISKGIYSVGSYNSWLFKTLRLFHMAFPYKKWLTYLLSAIYGWTPDELDPKYSTAVAAQFGSEVPLQIVTFYKQSYSTGGYLRMFDRGETQNLKQYGTKVPPLFPLNKITIPVFLIYSKDDYLCDFEGNEILYSILPEHTKVYGKLVVEGLNHIDFAFGRHRNEKVYDKVLSLLEKINN